LLATSIVGCSGLTVLVVTQAAKIPVNIEKQTASFQDKYIGFLTKCRSKGDSTLLREGGARKAPMIIALIFELTLATRIGCPPEIKRARARVAQ